MPVTSTQVKKLSPLTRKTLLLTGGSGLVGRNIQDHPLSTNWSIIAPSRIELDLMNPIAVFHFIEKCKPETIIHAAGLVGGIQANISQPISFLDENLIMGRNVLMAARDSGIRNLINLGSTCMYPQSIDTNLSEDKLMMGDLEPTNEGYAVAKLVTTKLCQYINQERSEFCYKTLIPCNIYGRHDDFNSDTSHLIPAIIKKIYNAKSNHHKTVTIWGSGTARREFMYAEDLAEAILLAVGDLSNIPDIMNLGFGKDYSVNEYYQIIAEILDWNGNFEHDHSMPVGTHRKLSCINRQKKWGWSAPTSLRLGIENTYQYFTETST